jgi:hypothetical protein
LALLPTVAGGVFAYGVFVGDGVGGTIIQQTTNCSEIAPLE